MMILALLAPHYQLSYRKEHIIFSHQDIIIRWKNRCQYVTSASSSAAWMSLFWLSSVFFTFSSSWMVLLPWPIWSVKSVISSAKTNKHIGLSYILVIQNTILGQTIGQAHRCIKHIRCVCVWNSCTLQVLILSFYCLQLINGFFIWVF